MGSARITPFVLGDDSASLRGHSTVQGWFANRTPDAPRSSVGSRLVPDHSLQTAKRPIELSSREGL